MITALVLLLLGFVLLVYGAEKLVEAASSLAGNFGISNIVIGLTVVAFGTSAPEMAVNILAALEGSGEMVLANVLGSNIFNVLVILGLCSIIMPLTVKANTTWIEIPLSLLAALSVLILASDIVLDGSPLNLISRSDGLVLLMFFVIFLVYNIMVSQNPDNETEDLEIKKLSTGKSLFWIFVGLSGLVLGGHLIVDNAVAIASSYGWSQRIIGLTIVSIGTSLPELATSLAAVKKKKVDIAIGNVVGSNIFNVFFILGISAGILPVNVLDLNYLDILMNIVSGLLLFAFVFLGKGRSLERWEGIALLCLYGLYMGYLLLG